MLAAGVAAAPNGLLVSDGEAYARVGGACSG